ncbi:MULTISPECIES: F0F1 ATP synthase subunit B [unclassified Methylocaldum]|uniref:F0F1 ATP synthase subunit B n=1 Tax=unclassified Methylocaldum TaxID=2622260 RepID=UPI000A324475|nr:F-type H+-transporting ATPase subunit b [Methylocaldum sp. RMAD-M]MDV3242251.1 F0F1 ATP synthase subunit B [Methylocaldum sp.]
MSINATLIGQMITFALLVWFTMKYVWPPLMQALEERKKKIADGLASAEKGKHEMELAEKRATALLREAKDQAADIVNLAQKRASEVVEESKQSAKDEGERIVAAAKAEIERELQQAKEGLRQQVAVLAISAAEQILQKEVDQKKHREIIDNLGKQLGQA